MSSKSPSERKDSDISLAVLTWRYQCLLFIGMVLPKKYIKLRRVKKGIFNTLVKLKRLFSSCYTPKFCCSFRKYIIIQRALDRRSTTDSKISHRIKQGSCQRNIRDKDFRKTLGLLFISVSSTLQIQPSQACYFATVLHVRLWPVYT